MWEPGNEAGMHDKVKRHVRMNPTSSRVLTFYLACKLPSIV